MKLRLVLLLLALVLTCSLVMAQWFSGEPDPEVCTVCGKVGRATDLTVVSPYDGTSRGNVPSYIVFRCPGGHLYSIPDRTP